MKAHTFLSTAWLAAVLGTGCASPEAIRPVEQRLTPATHQLAGEVTASLSVHVRTKGAPADDPRTARPLSTHHFRQLVETLSEPDADFFSDNFISNETSYLQITDALGEHVSQGGVYLGVGPEQNFTYIALTKPSRAYIVDVRRDNMVHHLLFKAAFDTARSRSEFLTLLTGRPYDDQTPRPADGSIDQVLAHAERLPATQESYEQVHRKLLSRIEGVYGFELDATDSRSLQRSHRAFFSDGLDIRFKLRDQAIRKYPSLRELLTASDPRGRQQGFLATEDAFRFVQRMQRENRIIPLVGDFAGDRAMPGLAAHLAEERLTVSSFYVSNVEQYLMGDGVWWKWRRNIAALPTDDRSVFIRAYLDQGNPHPEQMSGHRTTTTLQRIADFNQRKRPYASMLALATDHMLALR
ncbi:MAG: hypothetical protein DRI90_08060 [Deltaproteobacteria bacterium]|nr:MAG: hypothetical protein DRI90_08060 [Deltaproteobacteria bacterium]